MPNNQPQNAAQPATKHTHNPIGKPTKITRKTAQISPTHHPKRPISAPKKAMKPPPKPQIIQKQHQQPPEDLSQQRQKQKLVSSSSESPWPTQSFGLSDLVVFFYSF